MLSNRAFKRMRNRPKRANLVRTRSGQLREAKEPSAPSYPKSSVAAQTKLSDVLDALRSAGPRALVVPRRTESKDAVILGKDGDEESEFESKKPLFTDTDGASAVMPLMRSLFKRDMPYRTRLCLSGVMSTSAAGVLNFLAPLTGISSTNEWGSIDVLFNEVFVHSLTLRFFPHNRLDGAQPVETLAATATAVGTNNGQVNVFNSQFVAVSIFSNTGAYATASPMSNNPNRRYGPTGKPFTYVWRNNNRFDRHGVSLGPLTAIGWQGWIDISDISNIGGFIQVRIVNDQGLGDLAHAVTMGVYVQEFDCSFRVRA